MPKTAKQKPQPQAQQVAGAANVGVQWANMYPQTVGTAGNYGGGANIMWQGTSSGATYTAASSVLPK